MGLIFGERWWLDAVAPGRWEEVNVSDGADLSARLPFVRRRHWSGIVSLGAPPLTPRLGPLIEAPTTGRKLSRQLSDLTSIMKALIAELPEHDHFAQNCTPEFTYWLPFFWAGFEQTTQYSYVLDDLHLEDERWRGLSQSHRRKITRGGEQYELRYDVEPRVLIDLLRATYERQGHDLPTDPGVVERIHEAVVSRDAGRQIIAVDRRGRPLAGALLVWDDRTTYYLLGGRVDHDGPDAMPLVLWDGIKQAAKVSQRFDFEGSMIEGIERFFRGFGARPEPYFFLSRSSTRMELANLARGVGVSLKAAGAKRPLRLGPAPR